MKLILIIVVVLILAGSLVADYKWRQWMAARRRERDHPDPRASR
jgi:hypothetical protein